MLKWKGQLDYTDTYVLDILVGERDDDESQERWNSIANVIPVDVTHANGKQVSKL